MKRFLIVLLALLLCLGGAVGCTPPPNPIGPDGEGGETVFEDDPSKHYEIKFFMPAMGTMDDLDVVVDEINKITEKEINASVNIVAYNYYEYSQKMTNVIASSEKFDICHTSPAVNHYFLNIERRAFLPIDGLLDKYAPVTKSLMPEDLWKQLEVNGKKYATVNMQILPRTFSYYLNDAKYMKQFIAEKYPEYTIDTVWTAPVHKLKLVEEFLEWMRTGNKGLGGYTSRVDTVSTLQNLYGFDDMCTGMGCPGAVRASDNLKDGKLTVVNQFDTDEYREMLEYATRWRKLGYIDSKRHGSDPNELDIMFCSTWKPGAEQVGGDGTVHMAMQLGEPTYFSSFILGTMNAISSRSENPARAMKFIELMSSNKELHNLLQFGVEGIHYNKVEDNENRIELVPNSAYDNKLIGWALGNEFISYVYGPQPDDVWEKTKNVNDTARKPSVIGFNFDPNPVKQKIADCLAVSGEFTQTLSEGGYDDQDKAYKEFLNRLDAAGAKEVIAEKQRQLDEWVKLQLAK